MVRCEIKPYFFVFHGDPSLPVKQNDRQLLVIRPEYQIIIALELQVSSLPLRNHPLFIKFRGNFPFHGIRFAFLALDEHPKWRHCQA